MEQKTSPEFQLPEPSRAQRLSLRAAGLLLHESDAAATLHAVATDIGGYEVVEDPAGGTTYKTSAVRRTTSGFRSEAEMQDIIGRDMASAVERTVDGSRLEGERADKVRSKLARWLVKRAVAKVGVRAHIEARTADESPNQGNAGEVAQEQAVTFVPPEMLPYPGDEEILKQRAELADSPGVQELLLASSLHGNRYDARGFVRREQELAIRHKLADIYEKNPATAELLVRKQVMGFHGTRSVALADILEQGALLSAAEANARGIATTTGEHLFQPETGQRSISFTSLAKPEHALTYAGAETAERSPQEAISTLDDSIAEMRKSLPEFKGRAHKILANQIANRESLLDELKTNPDSLRSQLYRKNFPVLLGVSREAALKTDKADWRPLDGTTGDYAEFRAGSEELPLSELTVAVPGSQVPFVRDLIKQKGLDADNVIAIEDIQT